MTLGPNAHIGIRDTWLLVAGNPVPYLNWLRDYKNTLSIYPPGKTRLEQTKFEFGEFVLGHGGRAPRTLAIIRDSIAFDPDAGAGQPLEQFLRALPPGHYFCKPNDGHNGIGAIRLDVLEDRTLTDGAERDPAAVQAVLASQDYLIQESVTPRQHPDIARFHDGIINTLRLITFDTDGGARAVAASLRMAIAGTTIDSWTQGGVVAPIDIESGVLGPLGVLKKGLKLVDAHPRAGISFDGQPIPYLKEAIQLACRLHDRLAVKSLGWDIALLADGPCILEANRPWDIYMSAQLNPEFVERFLAFHLDYEPQSAVRLELSAPFADQVKVRRWLCSILGTSLASGRIDELTSDRMAVTIGNSAATVRSVVEKITTLKSPFGPIEIRGLPATDEPRPGIDLAVAFSDSA